MIGVRTAVAVLLTSAVAAPAGLTAQSVDGRSIAGDWVRAESNNHPLDGMRITVSGASATLTYVPLAGSFEAGQLLWKSIDADGGLLVRGSDGNYYTARLTFDGKYLQLDIDHSGAGHDQRWMKAGPSIDGEWVRVAPADAAGLKVRAAGGGATVTYLPASAPRGLRVGSAVWRDVGEGGAASVMTAGGRYASGRITLESETRLRVDVPGYPSEVWARPGTETAVGALPDPRPSPGPEDGLEPADDLPAPGLPPTPATPPAAEVACMATSMRDDPMGATWGFGMTSPTYDADRAEELGLTPYRIDDFDASRRLYQLPVDVDRSRLSGFDDGFSYAWLPNSLSGRAWILETDLTSEQYHARWESYGDDGYRPSDFEAYRTPEGMRYAGIWVHNSEGVDWWSRRDMPSAEYGEVFDERRAAGFRLVDMEAYDTPSGIRYAGIWYRSCDADDWRQWRGMDRDEWQARVDEMDGQGFELVDFESYRTPAGQRYAGIWEKPETPRGWAVRTDRTLRWFVNYDNEYRDLGFRLIDFESYETEDGIRYAGIWVENEPRYRFAFRPILDDSLEAWRPARNDPSMTVVILQDGETIYERGLGWADSADAKRAHSGTIYLLASVSKAIAGTLAARLDERGRIDVTEATGEYVEDLPSHHTHTIEELLSKTGCVWHYPQGPTPPERYYELRETALTRPWTAAPTPGQVIWDAPLLTGCTPGQQWHYSTHSYTFVGAALEAKLGKPIAEILRDELTQPFGLRTMRVASTEEGVAAGFGASRPAYDLAQAYAWNGTLNRNDPIDYEDSSWKALGGGIQASAADLARFGAMTLDGSIVPVAEHDDLLWGDRTVGTTRWMGGTVLGTALGWEVRTLADGTRVAEHGGIGDGARTAIGVYREDGLVIVILTNRRNSSLGRAGGLVDRIRQIVVNNPPPAATS